VSLYRVALHVGAVSTGMMAGLLFVFSTTVVPSILAIPQPYGLAAMQSINRRITEPFFGLIFLGGVGSSLVAIVGSFSDLGERTMSLAAGVVYLIGFFVVTASVHIPLNTQLDKADLSSANDLVDWESAAMRWRRFNHLRALAATAACVLFVLAVSDTASTLA